MIVSTVTRGADNNAEIKDLALIIIKENWVSMFYSPKPHQSSSRESCSWNETHPPYHNRYACNICFLISATFSLPYSILLKK